MKPNRLQYARLYHQDGRLRDAEELYRQLLVEYPEDAGICYEAGQLADELGAIELAISRLQRACELDSSDACGASAALARVLMHSGQIRQAGLYWLRLTRHPRFHHSPQIPRSTRFPKCMEAWAGVLVCTLSMGRKYLARRAAGVLSTHTSRSERRDILTQLWHDVSIGTQMQRITDGRYEYHGAAATPLETLLERARTTFTEHDAQYPDRADTQYHLAVCHDALDEHADASVRINLALRINPRYASAQRLALKICQADSRAA